MTFTPAQENTILSYMNSKIGHPYSESLSLRLGPTFFDCSGLVYDAMHAAGINIPRSDAIAASEANWLGANGAQVIKDHSQIQQGDIVFFHGAAPGPSNYGGIGHVGVAESGSSYVSAFDTALGVVKQPLDANDGFVVAMRLGKGGTGSPQPNTGGTGGAGITGISWPSQITDFFGQAKDFATAIMWIMQPGSWLRIVAFLAGVALLLFAIHALIAAANGEPLVKMPPVIPVPV